MLSTILFDVSVCLVSLTENESGYSSNGTIRIRRLRSTFVTLCFNCHSGLCFFNMPIFDTRVMHTTRLDVGGQPRLGGWIPGITLDLFEAMDASGMSKIAVEHKVRTWILPVLQGGLTLDISAFHDFVRCLPM